MSRFAHSHYQLKSGLELGRELGPGRTGRNHLEQGGGEKGGVRDTQKNVGPILRNSKVKRRSQMWCRFRDHSLDFE